ncbi:MAG: hypothetical protein ACTSUV_06280, partial [Candidatus Ranarchaeia archaeon]
LLGATWCFGSHLKLNEVVTVLQKISKLLGIELIDLPVVGLTPELRTNESIADSLFLMANGIPITLGNAPEFIGSKLISEYFSNGLKEKVDSFFSIMPDKNKATQRILDILKERRNGILK